MEAVIFDLGSTLIYFDGDWADVLPQSDLVLLRQLQAAGLNLESEAFVRQFRATLEAYFAERDSEFIEYTTAYILRNLLDQWGYPNVPDKIIRKALKAMYAVTQAHWKREEDAIPTLEELLERGYHLGMISNASDDADVQALVDKAQLRPYFEIILTSAAEGIRKPDPRIFQKALDFWGIPPNQAVMVGDTLGADILGAHNAGMTAVWIKRRADTPANHAHQDTIHPDASLHKLGELPDLLDRLDHR